MIGNVYSDDDRFDEKFLANYAIINMQNPLARLPGIGQVKVVGAGTYSMRVWLDPTSSRTRPHNRRRSERDPGPEYPGRFWTVGGPQCPRIRFPVHGQGLGSALGRGSIREHHRQVPVAVDGSEQHGSLERHRSHLRNRANQGLGARRAQPADVPDFSGFSGKKAAQLNVYTLPGANALAVAHAVRPPMEEMRRSFRRGILYAAARYLDVHSRLDSRRLLGPFRGGDPGLDRHHAVPAELPGDAGAGDDGACDDHRSLRGDGRCSASP